MIRERKFAKILLISALESELVEWHPANAEVDTLLTGVGKTSTACRLTESIVRKCPDAVINVGTAGSIKKNVGDILVCYRFVDRDLQKCSSLGLDAEIILDNTFGFTFRSIIGKEQCDNTFAVNTGDSFVTDTEGIVEDAVDMEAFSAASVCRHFSIPFVSVKYITDIIGKNSVGDWRDKLAQARMDLQSYLGAYDF